MRFKHSWPALALLAGILLAQPGFAAPQHVVSAFLCTDEYVFRLLPRERIAALSYLAGDTNPVVSTIADRVRGIDLIRPSAETVFARHPDLVVMYAGTNPHLREHLKAANIAVLDVPWAKSLADVRKITLMLGEKLGAVDKARAMLARMDARLDAARKVAPHPPVGTLIYEPNGYATAGGMSDELMRIAGLKNLAPSMGQTRLGTIAVESVVAAAPALLILNGSHERAPARADAVLKHPALAALKGHSLITRANLTPLLCPGPWSAQTAQTFAKLGQQAAALAKRAPAP